MCEFCHKHGEGKKWYLEANNYSEDLLSDLRRREFIIDFLEKPESRRKSIKRLNDLDKAPGFVKRAIIRRVSNKMKKVHFGQVVPIEEIKRIFEFVTSVARFACVCRHATLGSEQRYCFGVSMAPQGGELARIVQEIDASYLTGPNTAGIEQFSKEDALSFMRENEQEGLCHTVWTFIAPFIGGICNCDKTDCLAMRSTVTHGLPVMFRAEYIAKTDPDLCNGCRLCMRVCQFGAIGYSAALEKSSIDPRRCFGCGICRSVCTREAISLVERLDVPVAKSLW
jgi:ferredoxin